MNRTWKIIKNILVGIVVAVALCMMIFTVVSVTTVNRNDRNLFGYQMYIVLSNSMSATDFDSGDLILVKRVKPSALQEGDIIAYVSQAGENFGETVTHKIRRKVVAEDGAPGFVTYGTTTGQDDEQIVTYSYIQGKYIGRLPKVGFFFNFLKTVPGYVLCILTPFLLLILWQAISFIRLLKRYRAEQMSGIKEEREKLEAERAETQKMLDELKNLKEKMGLEKAESEENSINALGVETKPESVE